MTYVRDIDPARRPVTLNTLMRMRTAGEPVAMLTCYDSTFAAVCDAAGADVLLVGDSLGNVLQGHDTTLPVTLDDMAYHTACVARGLKNAEGRAFLIADMPFGSYQEHREQALRSAVKLLTAGAQMVKLEGGAHMADTVNFLVERGVPVCAHLGLTPQSVHQLGGYRAQGVTDASAEQLRRDAQLLDDAGATMMVLEMVPARLAAEVSTTCRLITIGIGAGLECAGQVLVLHDVLGLFPGRRPRFVRNFMPGSDDVQDALGRYISAVKERSFPGPEHCY
ncbi:MAG: 3-methyl-2-oxobutanoate hydroxymethyltransferase [Gammaproteobacteria bacterium]|jgi:3-methyl-2-oxobutanoate hydroxymethyltransferase|nr:3-methyl-2-oxobutanoate hydroxymethyltransferase [Gammaproteobacteria bacterium]MBU0773064.1 3-methyl-2-oxobutanoate hydroxymethyltransferase [Gammaproteobacteria bacterium]MBU0854874.1 3-methyl-2-oxobutanoate hydroxymethyltransferase [Gammaproteobacteria bacterium]MBU1845272.1 3-methyl-2-oxobutanoate hydroxymethyltransferase [Gammaproteobacteria bacterium]